MKNHEDILAKAIESLKNQPIPPGPPQEVLDSTLQKLSDSAPASHAQQARRVSHIGRIADTRNFISLAAKVAAVAAVLVLTGYAIGRLTAPNTPDVKQLRTAIEHSLTASLEPAIRQTLLEETDRRLQLALAQASSQIVADLTQQYRSDLNQFAVQTLTASNVVTNHLLAQLIDSIETAQTQDRRSVAAALYQIERNRLRDNTELATGLETLAYHTEDQLQQTKQDMVQLLSYAKPSGLAPSESRNSNNK
jgi:hypothetical protein